MADWRGELARWLAPFVERFGHKARRRMCPLYVAGLIGPGDRKSVGPMAEDEAPLERKLAIQADKLVGGAGAFLVIDDTTLPKKGTHSVGVAPQYASALGKTANCQTLVSLTLARGEVPVMVGLRLFLPETWTCDEARLERAGVPAEYRSARAKYLPDHAGVCSGRQCCRHVLHRDVGGVRSRRPTARGFRRQSVATPVHRPLSGSRGPRR